MFLLLFIFISLIVIIEVLMANDLLNLISYYLTILILCVIICFKFNFDIFSLNLIIIYCGSFFIFLLFIFVFYFRELTINAPLFSILFLTFIIIIGFYICFNHFYLSSNNLILFIDFSVLHGYLLTKFNLILHILLFKFFFFETLILNLILFFGLVLTLGVVSMFFIKKNYKKISTQLYLKRSAYRIPVSFKIFKK